MQQLPLSTPRLCPPQIRAMRQQRPSPRVPRRWATIRIFPVSERHAAVRQFQQTMTLTPLPPATARRHCRVPSSPRRTPPRLRDRPQGRPARLLRRHLLAVLLQCPPVGRHLIPVVRPGHWVATAPQAGRALIRAMGYRCNSDLSVVRVSISAARPRRVRSVHDRMPRSPNPEVGNRRARAEALR